MDRYLADLLVNNSTTLKWCKVWLSSLITPLTNRHFIHFGQSLIFLTSNLLNGKSTHNAQITIITDVLCLMAISYQDSIKLARSLPFICMLRGGGFPPIFPLNNNRNFQYPPCLNVPIGNQLVFSDMIGAFHNLKDVQILFI